MLNFEFALRRRVLSGYIDVDLQVGYGIFPHEQPPELIRGSRGKRQEREQRKPIRSIE